MADGDDKSFAGHDPEKICVALALRIARWSYRDIADRMGVDPRTAVMMVVEGTRNKPAGFDAARFWGIINENKPPLLRRKPPKRIERKR